MIRNLKIFIKITTKQSNNFDLIISYSEINPHEISGSWGFCMSFTQNGPKNSDADSTSSDE